MFWLLERTKLANGQLVTPIIGMFFRSALVVYALAWTAHVTAASSGQVAQAEPVFNSVLKPLLRVNWHDALNPRFVNLGDDVFLFDTRQGIKLWNASTRQLTEPEYSGALGAKRLQKIEGKSGQASLGSGMGASARGMAFIATGLEARDAPETLWWWNGATGRFAAEMPLAAKRNTRLLQLAADHLLVCSRDKTNQVLRLRLDANRAAFEHVPDGDATALTALQSLGVVGAVSGFGTLTLADPKMPMAYDVSHCDWEMRHAPEYLKPFFGPVKPGSEPNVHRHVLNDGRIMVVAANYHDGKVRQDLNPALLWDPVVQRWIPVEHSRESGARESALSSLLHGPVVISAFESDVVEFFNPKTLRWTRSVERLPEGYGAHVEPLKSGKALVLMFESHASSAGMVGEVEPMQGDWLPAGHLRRRRGGYDSFIALRDGSMLLAGGGSSWYPSTTVERVGATTGRSQLLASLPEQVNAATGLELRDGSVLVLAGLPKACAPEYVADCRPAQPIPSFRYFPKENRWQTLPELRVRFERGPFWQTGNSGLTSQWQRKDILTLKDGRVVWLDAIGSVAGREESLKASQLMVWKSARQATGARPLAKLRESRVRASLVELIDGRLVVAGGKVKGRQGDGELEPTKSTEILSRGAGPQTTWRTGPRAFFAGGQAMKLANGRIFKLSLAGDFDEQGLRAEVADAKFTRWTRLPTPPLKKPAVLTQVLAVGNRVVLLTDQGPTLAWDDSKRQWLIWKTWPTVNKAQISTATTDGFVGIAPSTRSRAWVRSTRTFSRSRWP
jgi:hypothetical protein